MDPLSIALFLGKHWKIIAKALGTIAVAVALYIVLTHIRDHYIDEGRAEADKLWTLKYNADIAAKNKRIKQLEDDSHKAATELAAERRKAAQDIHKLYMDWLNEKAKNKAKSTVQVKVKCPPGTVSNEVVLKLDTGQLMLPDSYVDTWNAMNHAAMKGSRAEADPSSVPALLTSPLEAGHSYSTPPPTAPPNTSTPSAGGSR